MTFSIKDFFNKCEEILNGKLHFCVVNPMTSGIYKMVKYELKILEQMLQDVLDTRCVRLKLLSEKTSKTLTGFEE